MRKLIKDWGVLASSLTAIAIVIGATVSYVGIPPYAAKAEVEELAIQVAANTEAGWLRQLENAIARNDQFNIRRLCNIVAKLYGYKAAGCP